MFSSVLMSHKLIWQNYQPAKSFLASHCATPEFSSSLLSNVVLCYFNCQSHCFLVSIEGERPLYQNRWFTMGSAGSDLSLHQPSYERTWKNLNPVHLHLLNLYCNYQRNTTSKCASTDATCLHLQSSKSTIQWIFLHHHIYIHIVKSSSHLKT